MIMIVVHDKYVRKACCRLVIVCLIYLIEILHNIGISFGSELDPRISKVRSGVGRILNEGFWKVYRFKSIHSKEIGAPLCVS